MARAPCGRERPLNASRHGVSVATRARSRGRGVLPGRQASAGSTTSVSNCTDFHASSTGIPPTSGC
ncbi:hypothetical protein NQU49_25785, partial [Escherichia coli]|nr:hypothetical protein [Escherichia coli]